MNLNLTLREMTYSDDPHYSQYGEAAMIDWLIKECLIDVFYVVEFGASTGSELSNTWHLAEAGAHGLYIEADPGKWEQLRAAVDTLPTSMPLLTEVKDIDEFLHTEPQVMSIDVDGEDWFIFDRMEARPDIVVIEHHPMIPIHEEFVGGKGWGSSAKSIAFLGIEKGYLPVGMTECNTILLHGRHATKVRGSIEITLPVMFNPRHVTYAVSNVYNGDYKLVGDWPFGRGKEIP